MGQEPYCSYALWGAARRLIEGLGVGGMVAVVLWCSCTVYRPSVTFDSVPRFALLTFDDGPNGHGEVTERLLDVLHKHNVRAMFCLIGTNVLKYPAIVQRMYQEGHIIANHGYSEWPVVFRSTRSIGAEMDGCTQALREVLADSQFTPYCYRPAFGWYNRRARRCARERGWRLGGFNCYAGDAQADSSRTRAVVRRALRCLAKRRGGILVMHDGKAEHERLLLRVRQGRSSYERLWVPAAVDSLIVQLKLEGYTLPALDEGRPNTLPSEYARRFRMFFF